MDSTDLASPTRHTLCGWWFVTINAVVAAMLIALVCGVRAAMYFEWLSATWHFYSLWIWVVAADLAVIGMLIFTWPRQRPVVLAVALLPHLLVLGTAGLLVLQRFDAWAMRGLELLVCGGIATGWLFVIGGVIALLIALACRIHGAKRIFSRRWLRCWLATAVFLGTAEAAIWLIESAERPLEARLKLPDRYRNAPPNEQPIVALGGSTMLGFPYQPQISIPIVLAESLRRSQADVAPAVRNLAQTGINFQRAADRLTQLEIRPRLLLLYTGHNEYFYDAPPPATPRRWPRRLFDPVLEWSGFYRWVRTCIPQELGSVQVGPAASIIRRSHLTPEMLRRRHEQFRVDLIALAEHCRRHEIPTLWFLPAASEGIFLPNRSVAPRSLSPAADRELNQNYRRCRRLIEQGKYEPARAGLAQLNAQYPGVAEIEFWFGVCLREVGQIDAAREWFRRSIDHDGQPASANSAYRAIIADVAGRFGIELIDAAAVLRRVSPTGLLDRHVIHDNVHPTLRGYHALGLAALRSRTVATVFATESLASAEPSGLEEVLHRRRLTAADLATAYERIAYCLRTLAKMRTDGSLRAAHAEQYERWAVRLERGEIAPGEHGTEALTGDAIPGVRLEQ